jgi:hypothetical protein
MAPNGVKSLGKGRKQGIINLGIWEISLEDKRTARVQTNVQWRWALISLTLNFWDLLPISYY